MVLKMFLGYLSIGIHKELSNCRYLYIFVVKLVNFAWMCLVYLNVFVRMDYATCLWNGIIVHY